MPGSNGRQAVSAISAVAPAAAIPLATSRCAFVHAIHGA